MPKKEDKYVFLRRLSDGRTMDLPFSAWEDMTEVSENIRQQGASSSGAVFELIEILDLTNNNPPNAELANEDEPPVTTTVNALQIEEDPLECPICSKVFKDEDAIKKHKEEHA